MGMLFEDRSQLVNIFQSKDRFEVVFCNPNYLRSAGGGLVHCGMLDQVPLGSQTAAVPDKV